MWNVAVRVKFSVFGSSVVYRNDTPSWNAVNFPPFSMMAPSLLKVQLASWNDRSSPSRRVKVFSVGLVLCPNSVNVQIRSASSLAVLVIVWLSACPFPGSPVP